MQSWGEIGRWRREQRASLIARRQAIPQDERRPIQPLILDVVERHFLELADALLRFYRPFRGEIGGHGLVGRLLERGVCAALRVVVANGQPLEFWAWQPGMPLRRDVWDIPIPTERQEVRPTALLAPLVSVDRRGYGLGYGGGYHLAVSGPVHPQPHDIPMDAIVTEAGIARFGPDRRRHGALAQGDPFATIDEDPNSRAACASPPCFIHEVDRSCLGLTPNRDDGSADDGPAGADAGNKTDAR